jgi:hypothetical protein
MENESLIRGADCCACGIPLYAATETEIVAVPYKAKWEYPQLNGVALAFICSDCGTSGRLPTKSIEIRDHEIDFPQYLYHMNFMLDPVPTSVLTELVSSCPGAELVWDKVGSQIPENN